MDEHPISQWKTIIRRLSEVHIGTARAEAVADRIIVDLAGYRHKSFYRKRDTEELANALIAYASELIGK